MELGNLIRAGQKKDAFHRIRLLAHAARWQPDFAGELVTLLFFFREMGMVQAIPDFRKVATAILEAGGYESFGEPRRRIQLLGAIAAIDDGRALLAQQALRDFNRQEAEQRPGAPPDVIAAGMARLWGLNALLTGEELPQVATRLEQVLAANLQGDPRHLTVTSLASIYRRQNRMAEEMQLLTKELANPEVTRAGEGNLTALRRRLTILQQGTGGDGPAQAAQAWLRVHTSPWLDYARPKTLKDAGMDNLDQLLDTYPSRLLPAEMVKVCLLVAQDATQPEARRHAAVVRLGWYSGEIAQSPEEASRWVDALLDEKALPQEVRAQTLDFFLRRIFVNGDRALLRKYLPHPLLQSPNDQAAAHFRLLHRFSDIAPTDLDKKEALVTALLSETVTPMAGESIGRMIGDLAYAGRIEAARRLYQSVGAARFEVAPQQKRAFQLTLLKTINRAATLQPMQEALCTLYLKHRPSPSGELSANATPREDRGLNLSEADATTVRETWLRDGLMPRHSITFWADLLDDLPTGKQSRDLGLAMLTLALEKAPDEETRVGFVVTCLQYLDIDDADTRVELAKVLQPYRALPDQPLLGEAIRVTEARIKLRTEDVPDALPLLRDFKDPRFQMGIRRRLLPALMARQDTGALRQYMDAAPMDELLEGRSSVLVWRAYLALGQKDEAELTAETVRDNVYNAILRSWVDPADRDVWTPLYLAESLGEPQLIPAGYVNDLSQRIKQPARRLQLLCQDAVLRKAWDDCARFAEEACRLYPTHYDFFRELGLALGHLGRKEEAVRALRTYLKYTHNDVDALTAREMLNSLTK